MNDKLIEECAVFGISLKDSGAINSDTDPEAVGITYNGLLALQHRGQEGAGIAVVNNRKITCRKDMGLVTEVFPAAVLEKMPKGFTAVGHTRYSTAGDKTKENTVTEYLTGRIAAAHNGNIINSLEIRVKLNPLSVNVHGKRVVLVDDSLFAEQHVKKLSGV